MYLSYFGLTRNPFNMTPDPSVLYVTPSYQEALAGLAYAIMERKGFVVLTGEAGTGKTTLLARALKHLPTSRVVSSVILNPTLSEAEFLEFMMLDFGLEDIPASKAQRLFKFQRFLLQTKQAGKIATLVVDEAHKLSFSLLEEIRLLSNMELPEEKLLQVVLSGQPELIDVLHRPELRQLDQRIAVRLSIQLLTASDVERYIALRWSKSGPSPVPFSSESFTEIARWSRGIPRLVNSICDNALMLTFAETAAVVQPQHVKEACHDLCMLESGPQTYAPHNGRGADAVEAVRPIQTQLNPPAATDAVFVPLGPIRVMESYTKANAKAKRSFWPRWMSAGRRLAQ